MKSFIKSKKGNFVSICVIYPLWLLIIVFLVAQANNHQRLQEVIDTNQVVSRIIEKSATYSDAITSVNNYMSQLDSKNNYNIYEINNNSSYFQVIEIQKFVEGSGFAPNVSSITHDVNEFGKNEWWAEKNAVTYSITIYTDAHLSSIYKVSFMGYSFSLVDDNYTITSTVFLCG